MHRLKLAKPSRMAMLLAIAVSSGFLGLTPIIGQANPSEIAVTTVGNLAMGGFDPITFQGDNEPALGSDKIRYFWKGANWQFVSTENRDQFRATPEKFAPAYGGHGAWAVSVGEFLRGDPRLYRVDNGQLFLFYSADTRDKWADEPDLIRERANREWTDALPDMQ